MLFHDTDCFFSRFFLRISNTCTTAFTMFAITPNHSPTLPSVFMGSPFAGVIIRQMQNITVKTQNRTSRIQLIFVLFILALLVLLTSLDNRPSNNY